MPRCFAHDPTGDRCRNEAAAGALYCPQHAGRAADPAQKSDDLMRAMARLEAPKKDIWDRLGAISTLITGIFVGLVGIGATAIYNARQLDIAEAEQARTLQIRRVEIVQQFFPHLVADNDDEATGALLAIAALGDEKLAADLTEHFGGGASDQALARLAASASPEVAGRAAQVLDTRAIADRLRDQTVTLEIARGADGTTGTTRATAFVVGPSGLAVTAAHVLTYGGGPDTARLSVTPGFDPAAASTRRW